MHLKWQLFAFTVCYIEFVYKTRIHDRRREQIKTIFQRYVVPLSNKLGECRAAPFTRVAWRMRIQTWLHTAIQPLWHVQKMVARFLSTSWDEGYINGKELQRARARRMPDLASFLKSSLSYGAEQQLLYNLQVVIPSHIERWRKDLALKIASQIACRTSIKSWHNGLKTASRGCRQESWTGCLT